MILGRLLLTCEYAVCAILYFEEVATLSTCTWHL